MIFYADICSMEDHYLYHTIEKAIAYIRVNYQQQPNLDELADVVHLSKFHFQRTFQNWVGISPKEFLQFTTIEHAKKCLLKGQSTLQTAYETGLSGNSRLHDLFIKIESCTPGEFKNKSKGLTILISEFDTPFGKAAVAETEKGISNMIFGSTDELGTIEYYKNASIKNQPGKYGELVRNYFSTWKPPESPIHLDLIATPFQIQVWKALLSIPPANLAAYQDIAGIIHQPKAVRAVGTAIAKNPVAYLIPCHRVIRSNGDFGNYLWDAERKVIINAWESVVLSDE